MIYNMSRKNKIFLSEYLTKIPPTRQLNLDIIIAVYSMTSDWFIKLEKPGFKK